LGNVGLINRYNWPGLNAVIMTEYTREIRRKVATVRRFYISSSVDCPEKMAQHIRNHWQVENCLHWVLDVTFRQDACRIRQGNAAANFATINHAATNLLRGSKGKISLPQKRRSAAWDDDYMEALIRQEPSIDCSGPLMRRDCQLGKYQLRLGFDH
jgi:predicted transposase YbfD/YdcC